MTARRSAPLGLLVLTLACSVYEEGLLRGELPITAASGGAAGLGGSASGQGSAGSGGANAGSSGAPQGGVTAGGGSSGAPQGGVTTGAGSSGAPQGGVTTGGDSSGAGFPNATGGANNATGGSASGGSNGSGGLTSEGGGAGKAGTACGGKALNGICWYLGSTGKSCTAVCVAHGGIDAAMIAVTGTPAQGGSRAQCQMLMSLFGATGTIGQGSRTDGLGLGCHFYRSLAWWLEAPAFSDDAGEQNARILCGCNE